jgi:hypothetical protein
VKIVSRIWSNLVELSRMARRVAEFRSLDSSGMVRIGRERCRTQERCQEATPEFGAASKVCDKVEELRAGDTLGVNHPSHRPIAHKHWRFIAFDPSQHSSQSVPESVPTSQKRAAAGVLSPKSKVLTPEGADVSSPRRGGIEVLPATRQCLQGFCEFLRCYRGCYRGATLLREKHYRGQATKCEVERLPPAADAGASRNAELSVQA